MKLLSVIVALTRSVQINGLNSASKSPKPSLVMGTVDRRPTSVSFASIWKPEQIPSTNLPLSAIFIISRATFLLMLCDSTRLPPGIIIMSKISEAGLPSTSASEQTRSVGKFPKSSKHGSAPGR